MLHVQNVLLLNSLLICGGMCGSYCMIVMYLRLLHNFMSSDLVSSVDRLVQPTNPCNLFIIAMIEL